MRIDYQLIKSTQQHTNMWAGGTTTQLAIWPPEADYAKRAFLWRLSTATVTQAESSFTALPGFKRILMVLSGAMELIHENQHRVHLTAFEQDFFDGAWNTRSVSREGTVIDFNLMLSEGVEGDMRALYAQAGSTLQLPEETPWHDGLIQQSAALYLLEGQIHLTLQGQPLNLSAKDTLLIHAHAPFNIPLSLHCTQATQLIYTRIALLQCSQ